MILATIRIRHFLLTSPYTTIDYNSPVAAAKVIASIFEKSQVLGHFPKIGHKYRDEPEGEIRILLYGHYRIAYLLRPSQEIDVLGVFHGALDIARYLL